jgi:hypothetical protein
MEQIRNSHKILVEKPEKERPVKRESKDLSNTPSSVLKEVARRRLLYLIGSGPGYVA